MPDECCPECGGPPELLLAGRLRLRKRCRDCGHKWSEEPLPGPLDSRGHVDLARVP